MSTLMNKSYVTEHRLLFALLMACSIYLLILAPAFATSTPMGDVLCKIVDMVYGNLGRGLATLAIIIVGVGATLGKVSWGLAILIAIGVAVVFNAKLLLIALIGAGLDCP